ncbi:hypothetical protein EYF80_027046 [Liparis tanakae]|uniref:Uncharacterized protein n=1 Tax=Liparis tanakae TaxID=230148 RepID=A0A4Z2HCT7_9TELE|nr:hypothetical protein EYF80_027046 [Liparis tanakae]
MGEEAFFRLARPDEGEALASVTQILPDPTGAFESAVNVSLLHSDPTGSNLSTFETMAFDGFVSVMLTAFENQTM